MTLVGLVLAIEIPWSPDIVEIGGFLLTWHGLFTAVGILVGVRLSLWIAGRIHYNVDDAYTLALIGVPSGIVGARLLFVAEHWEYYGSNLGEIIALTEGGISIWGAVLGGVAGPLAFALWRGWPVWRGLDVASFGLVTGMAIGRIGDLINGEHLAKGTDLPWGVIYTSPNALSHVYAHSLTVGAHHPATTYEMIGDLAILGVLFLAMFRWPIGRYPGATFFIYLVGYAVMRYFLSNLRLDSADTFLPFATVPQLVSVIVVAASLPVLYVIWRNGPDPHDPQAPPPQAAATPGRVPVREA
ncbi:MAG: prolipoprotein diacylglyceryl transferase [Dehalococcoidia bacterium]|nr:prolipoprotein diacylglyceryl transferase [Dehalococcoidia bacterium]